jgi:hypothetical protein
MRLWRVATGFFLERAAADRLSSVLLTNRDFQEQRKTIVHVHSVKAFRAACAARWRSIAKRLGTRSFSGTCRGVDFFILYALSDRLMRMRQNSHQNDLFDRLISLRPYIALAKGNPEGNLVLTSSHCLQPGLTAHTERASFFR